MRPERVAQGARRRAGCMHEFAHIIETAEIDAEGRHVDFAADASQRQALAARLGLLDLKELSVSCDVFRDGDNPAVLVQGRFHAEVAQKCVVTLEPVESTLDESFEVRFLPADEWEAHGQRDVEVTPDDEDVEPMSGSSIDLGATVTEYLALAIDPYPRRQDAEFRYDTGAEADPGPFAALAKLRNKV